MEEIEFIANRKWLQGETTSSCDLCGALIAVTADKQLYKLAMARNADILVGTAINEKLPFSCQSYIFAADENQPRCRIMVMLQRGRYFEV